MLYNNDYSQEYTMENMDLLHTEENLIFPFQDCILGLEFAGVRRGSNGQRAMGLVAAGGLATSVKADPLLTWSVPASWSLQDASTVPVVYATVSVEGNFINEFSFGFT